MNFRCLFFFGIIPVADATDELSLPASYAIVPAVALNESKTSVPALDYKSSVITGQPFT